jgi:tRNA 2-thiouridine synthesizing protein E
MLSSTHLLEFASHKRIRHHAGIEVIEPRSGNQRQITFLRDYYFRYQIAPAIRVLSREIGKRLGADKGNTRYLNQLFSFGPARQACRYAGLPKPTGCV